jgi:multiple sugar transport system substrate-binding protein
VLGLTLNQPLTGNEEPTTGLERANSLFESILKGNLMIPYQKDSYADSLDGAKALIAKK